MDNLWRMIGWVKRLSGEEGKNQKKVTGVSHVAFGRCHSQEMWEKCGICWAAFLLREKRNGPFTSILVSSVIPFPQLHPAVISNSCSGKRIPMAVVALCLWSEYREQVGRELILRPGLESRHKASATDAVVVALACSPLLQAVLSASLKHSLHSFNRFLRTVEGIGLFMMLQLLKCMTNTWKN